MATEAINTSMVYEEGTIERLKLKQVAVILNRISDELNTENFYVNETWLDYGAKMMWTTIIGIRKKHNIEYQTLYPNNREALLQMNEEEIRDWAKGYFNDNRAYEKDD